MTEILTQSGGDEYNIHFRTDNPEAYKTVQEICRLYIDREKRMPKKPIIDIIFPSGLKIGNCPVCNNKEVGTNTDFCCKCGQALNWSDTE